MDATFCAEITETDAVAGAIATVLLFPVAVPIDTSAGTAGANSKD